jgi:hypothetical protein
MKIKKGTHLFSLFGIFLSFWGFLFTKAYGITCECDYKSNATGKVIKVRYTNSNFKDCSAFENVQSETEGGNILKSFSKSGTNSNCKSV